MALMNELMVGRFNRYVQKIFSMKGGAALNQVSSELQMGMMFFSGVENRYFEGWDLFGYATSQNAGVGNASSIRFRNPAGSNVVAVFEGLEAYTSAASDGLNFNGNTNTALDYGTVLGLGQNGLDARATRNSTLIISTGIASNFSQYSDRSNSAVAADNRITNMLTGGIEFPLLPGGMLQVSNSVTNTSLRISARWRERFLEDSERK